jgi:hypothetical protein
MLTCYDSIVISSILSLNEGSYGRIFDIFLIIIEFKSNYFIYLTKLK